MTSKLQRIEKHVNSYICVGGKCHKKFCEEILSIIHGQDWFAKWNSFKIRGEAWTKNYTYGEKGAFNRLRECEYRRLERFITVEDLLDPEFKVRGLGKVGRELVLANPQKFLWEQATKS